MRIKNSLTKVLFGCLVVVFFVIIVIFQIWDNETQIGATGDSPKTQNELSINKRDNIMLKPVAHENQEEIDGNRIRTLCKLEAQTFSENIVELSYKNGIFGLTLEIITLHELDEKNIQVFLTDANGVDIKKIDELLMERPQVVTSFTNHKFQASFEGANTKKVHFPLKLHVSIKEVKEIEGEIFVFDVDFIEKTM